jgi:N-acetylglucosaminyldiphosphoundecaprenol N-acetyl-beta-D-mannosaminyltransferase
MNSTVQPSYQYPILGFSVDLYPNYRDELSTRLEQGLGTHVVTLNAEMVMQAEQNPELAEVIHNAEFVIPDGAGIVLYLKLKGKSVPRCPGIELAQSMIERMGCQQQSDLIVFYGGKPGVAQQAANQFKQQFPHLNIITYHGYLDAQDTEKIQKTLQELQPKLILVGLGVPRQELWIKNHRSLCSNATWIGVGGSFDIWSGQKKRAPAWFCEHHLEWLYRLYQEPWRWRRMLVLPQFALKALLSG